MNPITKIVPVIGLCGYARSGKDHIARALVEQGWMRFAFADALKMIIVEAGFAQDLQELEELKNNPAMRLFLQKLGVAVREVLGEDTWIRKVDGEIRRRLEADDVEGIVITDVRFKNEADYISSIGGVVVRVTRPGVGPWNDHVSETEIESIPADYVFINDGTDFENEVRNIELLARRRAFSVSKPLVINVRTRRVGGVY